MQPRQNDIEIAGFLAATIAWGNRKAIVKSAGRMIDLMEGTPHDFVMNASESELDAVLGYVHRTFNGGDLRSFLSKEPYRIPSRIEVVGLGQARIIIGEK